MNIEEEVIKEYLARNPNRIVRKVKILSDEGDTVIVRVYSHLDRYPDVIPTPYENLRFSKTLHFFGTLTNDEQNEWRIPHYK